MIIVGLVLGFLGSVTVAVLGVIGCSVIISSINKQIEEEKK